MLSPASAFNRLAHLKVKPPQYLRTATATHDSMTEAAARFLGWAGQALGGAHDGVKLAPKGKWIAASSAAGISLPNPG
jgi:hypothetical protein